MPVERLAATMLSWEVRGTRARRLSDEEVLAITGALADIITELRCLRLAADPLNVSVEQLEAHRRQQATPER